HTRSKRDWSSDVCSSDLGNPQRIVLDGKQKGAVPKALSKRGYIRGDYGQAGGQRFQWGDAKRFKAGRKNVKARMPQPVEHLVVKIGRASCRERVWRWERR